MKTTHSARSRIAKRFPRGRTPHAHRRQQILAGAFEEFAANGYAATRLEDVARQAGIAKGTIYLYFRDKEQLFRAVVRSLIKERVVAFAGTFHGPAPALYREMLSRMYAQVVRNERARGIVRLLVAESGKFPQLSDIYHQEIIGPGLRVMRRMLKRGIASGEFQKAKALRFPQLLIAPGVLAILWTLIFGERHRLDLDAYMKAHLDFVLGSLRKKRT
jgi:AcrR family transcriptional regulator